MPAPRPKLEEIARHLPPLESGTRCRTPSPPSADAYGIPPELSWAEFDFDAQSSSPAPAEPQSGYRAWPPAPASAPSAQHNFPGSDPDQHELAATSPYAALHRDEDVALRARDSGILSQLIDTYLASEHGIEGEDNIPRDPPSTEALRTDGLPLGATLARKLSAG